VIVVEINTQSQEIKTELWKRDALGNPQCTFTHTDLPFSSTPASVDLLLTDLYDIVPEFLVETPSIPIDLRLLAKISGLACKLSTIFVKHVS
jgi:hypothetical protein